MTKPVCLVIGAGAGIGGHVGQKFALENYIYALYFLKRHDNAPKSEITNLKESFNLNIV